MAGYRNHGVAVALTSSPGTSVFVLYRELHDQPHASLHPQLEGYSSKLSLWHSELLAGAPVTANMISRLSIAWYAANQTIIFAPLQDFKTDPIVLAHLCSMIANLPSTTDIKESRHINCKVSLIIPMQASSRILTLNQTQGHRTSCSSSSWNTIT